MLGFSISKEELKVFLEELEELLQGFELQILNLEKQVTPEGVQELFRIAHTIKGSAASIGYDSMAKLTHTVESVLDSVRQGKLQVNREMVELFFSSLDLLRQFKDGIASGKYANPDISGLHHSLESLVKKGGEKKEPSLMGTFKGQFSKPADSSLLAPGENLYEVVIRFAADCELPSVRAFQAHLELEKLGEVLQSFPTLEELKAGAVEFSEFLVSLKSRKDSDSILRSLKSVSELSEAKVVKMAQPEQKEGDSLHGPDLKQELKTARTIRVNVDVFENLMNLVGEIVIDKTRLISLGTELASRGEGGVYGEEILETTQHLDKMTSELQEQIMKARLVPIDLIFKKFPRMVRDLSARSGKTIEFEMFGEDTQLDRAIVEEMIDPLIHLLRNAVDHGIEPPEIRQNRGKPPFGRIKLSAYQEENHVVIQLQDDGGGIDVEKVKHRAVEKGIITKEESKSMSYQEALYLIFLPGFSTAEKVTDLSGRGVGMDIVKANLQKIGGTLDIKTEVGIGTTFTVKIPLTLAIVQALMVLHHHTVFAIPLGVVREIVKLQEDKIQTLGGKQVFILRGEVLPLTWIGEFYDEPFPEHKGVYNIVVVSYGESLVGVLVDEFLNKQEVVIKTMGALIGDVSGVAGATILGDGTVALIFDVQSFLNLVSRSRRFSQAA